MLNRRRKIKSRNCNQNNFNINCFVFFFSVADESNIGSLDGGTSGETLSLSDTDKKNTCDNCN